MEINQKVFKIDNEVKYFPINGRSGLTLIVNDIVSDIDFAECFVKPPEYFNESNEIKGYCILEQYFNHTTNDFTFSAGISHKIELAEITDGKILHAKIIKMRNPIVIMDEKEITQEMHNKLIERIIDVVLKDEESKRILAEAQEAVKKPVKVKLYENPIYDKDKNIYLKKGFTEYKNGNFRMLLHKTDPEVPTLLILLDKLSFDVLDTEKKGEIYEFELNEEKGVAYIENEALIIKKLE